MEIKDVLKALFEEHGLNANQLAAALDKKPAQPTIHRIESGESKNPRDETIEPIAKYFGITLGQLRGYEPLGAKLPPPTPALESPEVSRLIKAFGWLLADEKVEFLKELEAKAKGNMVISKELGPRWTTATDDRLREKNIHPAPQIVPRKRNHRQSEKAQGRPPDAALPDQ